MPGPGYRVPHISILRWRFAAHLTLLLPTLLLAQKPHRNDRSGHDHADRATILHTANVYVTGDSSAPPITTLTPGHDFVISAHNGPWLNVFINTDTPEDNDPDSKPEFQDPNLTPAPSSGWIRDKGVVGPSTVNGDVLLFGYAAELEVQAAQPHPPEGAAAEAHLLYARVGDYFPDSPLAAEALFRAADIRWQLGKADIATLPSTHEGDGMLRPRIYEGALKRVMKYFPNSPVAARAAFDLLDNKLCGDWQGLPNCPEKETQLYLQYADHYRTGPKSAEALYDAAYRQGVLVTMYQVDNNPKLAAQATKSCKTIADQLQHDYPSSDFADRAASIAFRVSQGIPIYGTDRD
jgi:hypothetical protein